MSADRAPVTYIGPAFLEGGGQTGEHIRAYDWSTTALGAPQHWPPALRTALRIMLTTNHPVFIFWGEDLICFYNDAYARSLGPEKHPRMLGMRGGDAWEEIWPIIGPQIDLVMDGRGATWHENHLVPITRFGRVEEVFWTYSYGPIHDDSAPNGVGGVLVLCTETTDRVMAEARIRADAERWRAIFEQSPGFICVLSAAAHVYEYCNPAYFELVGRTSDLIGLSVAEAFPEVVAQGFISMLDNVYASGQAHVAVAASVVLTGVNRLVDFVCQPMRDSDGRVTGVLIQGVDVTQREEAQSALRESASRLHMATDAAQIGIYEYDIRTGTMLWDDRVRELWGVPRTIGITYDIFLRGIVGDDRAAAQSALDRALNPAGDGMLNAEYRVRDGSGRERWVRATGRVGFEAGVAVRLIGTVQDISLDKANEAKLIAADRRKDVFLATLAHELRNPLAPIRNAARVLAITDVTREQVSSAQQIIERQSTLMASLLDDLLDVARLTQGRLELKRQSLELFSVLMAALEIVRPALEAKGHQLHLEIPQHGVRVTVDLVRLRQVFRNLLVNAIRYMEPGGRIDVRSASGATDVTISVRDTGIGISRESLSHVFGMFQQSSTALERAEGGLGIGLGIVRAIVELHGGSVRASSDGPGQGSEFFVTLPLSQVDDSQARLTQPLSITNPAAGRRVLIADDGADAAGFDAHLATPPDIAMLLDKIAR